MPGTSIVFLTREISAPDVCNRPPRSSEGPWKTRHALGCTAAQKIQGPQHSFVWAEFGFKAKGDLYNARKYPNYY